MENSLGRMVLSFTVLAASLPALAASVSLPNTFIAGDSISSAKVNSNFSALVTGVNNHETRITTLETNAQSPSGSYLVLYLDQANPATNNVMSRFQYTLQPSLDIIRSAYVTLPDAQTITINQAGTYKIMVSEWKCGQGNGTFIIKVYRPSTASYVFGRQETFGFDGGGCTNPQAFFLWKGFQAGDQIQLQGNSNNGGGYVSPIPDGSASGNAQGHVFIYREF